MTSASVDRVRRRVSVMRFALTGAIGLLVLMLICWLGVSVAPQQSHMYISLFTAEPVASTRALTEGLLWSAVFGGLSGALFAVLYNLLSFVERR